VVQHLLPAQGPAGQDHLDGEAVEEGRQPPRGPVGVLAVEHALGHPGLDQRLEDGDPSGVELRGDRGQGLAAQGLVPPVDPEGPGLVPTRGRQVLPQDPVQPVDGISLGPHGLAQAGDVGGRHVPEHLDQQLVLGREVVVDEARADAEVRGHIGHPQVGQPTGQRDLLGRLQDLGPALVDVLAGASGHGGQSDVLSEANSSWCTWCTPRSCSVDRTPSADRPPS